MLKKQQRAARLEHACQAIKGFAHRRYGAERELTHNGVDTGVAEKYLFARKGQELNLETQSALLSLC